MKVRELEGKDKLSKRVLLEFDPNYLPDAHLLKDMFELCIMHRKLTEESQEVAYDIIASMKIMIAFLNNQN